MALAARASRRKRATISGVSAYSAFINLMATRFPISRCTPSYTAPIEPFPISRFSLYLPASVLPTRASESAMSVQRYRDPRRRGSSQNPELERAQYGARAIADAEFREDAR